MPMQNTKRKQPSSRFGEVFWGTVMITLASVGIASFSCKSSLDREALNEALLTVFKLGCGAIIALVGRYKE